MFIGRILYRFLYLCSAGDENVREDVLYGLLRHTERAFRAFASYFQRNHAIELLAEVFVELHFQVWFVWCRYWRVRWRLMRALAIGRLNCLIQYLDQLLLYFIKLLETFKLIQVTKRLQVLPDMFRISSWRDEHRIRPKPFISANVDLSAKRWLAQVQKSFL